MAQHLTRLTDYLTANAHEMPNAEALVFGAHRVTYRQLESASELVARALVRVGVHRTDKVVLVAPPGPEYLAIFMAAASIGAVFVGIDPRQPFNEIEEVIHDAKPQVLIGMAEFGTVDLREDLATIMFACPDIEEFVIIGGTPHRYGVSFDDFLQAGTAVALTRVETAAEQCSPDDVAALIYTPTPTGALKGVMLTHRNFIEVYSRTAEVYRASPVRLINNYPINHINCLGGATAHAVIAGGCQVFMETFDAQQCLWLVARERITVWGQEVSMFQKMVAHPAFASTDFSNLQQIWWTGGIAPKSLVEKLAALPGICSTRWGLPETCGPITLTDPEADATQFGTMVGQATRGFYMRTVDARGRPVPENEPGRILVRGDCLMAGYYNRKEETADLFDEHGWFNTGYVGVLDETEKLKMIGPLDDVYIGGGYAIHPAEIERALERHPAVMRAVVLAVPDPVKRQIGVAWVEPMPGQQLPVPEIDAFARERLAAHAHLHQIWVRTHLPEDLVGNIDRKAMKVEAKRLLSHTRTTSPNHFRELDSI
jgi:fatty-acyl-CoA synthase